MLQNELLRIVTPETLSSIDIHLLSGLHRRAIPTPVPAPSLSYACWYLQTVPDTCQIPRPCQALHSQRACHAEHGKGTSLFNNRHTSSLELVLSVSGCWPREESRQQQPETNLLRSGFVLRLLVLQTKLFFGNFQSCPGDPRRAVFLEQWFRCSETWQKLTSRKLFVRLVW